MPQRPYDTVVTEGGARPFRVALPESLLADLQERLDRPRCPDEIPGSGWSYGTSLSYARELASIQQEFATTEKRKAAALEYYSEMFGSDLAAKRARTTSDPGKARRVAHAFRFVCPSYYMTGD